MSLRLLTGLLLLPAAWLRPSPVFADETAPMRMISCSVVPSTIERRGMAPPETIRVTFMLTGDVPADLVRFTAAAPAGGFHEFTAHGTFTKATMILNRELHADPAEAAHPLPKDVQCLLTYVHFVDGTSWTAPGF